MGPETHYEAVLEHPELGELTWGIWEYSLGIENYSNTDIGDHEMVENLEDARLMPLQRGILVMVMKLQVPLRWR